jgi:hypothetical protein
MNEQRRQDQWQLKPTEPQQEEKEPNVITKKPRRVELTERDLSVLRWTGEQYAAALNQLQRVLGAQAGPGAQTPGILSESAARVWVSRMRTIGAVEQEKPYKNMPPFVWLTAEGLRLAGLDFKMLHPATSTLHHLYWCSQARLYLAARRPGDIWIPERQLRSEQAQAILKGQRRVPALPDAHLVTAKGIIAIEIELTEKQAGRLLGIVRRRVSEYFTVWYFTNKETRSCVEAVRKQLTTDQRERVQIYDINQLTME